jgi:hypothetical protein
MEPKEYTPLNLHVVLVKPSMLNKEGIILPDKTKEEMLMELVFDEGLEVYKSAVKELKPKDRIFLNADTRKEDFQIIHIGKTLLGEPREYLSIHYNRIIGKFSG